MGDSSVPAAAPGALVPTAPKPEHAPASGADAAQQQPQPLAEDDAGASPSSSPGEGAAEGDRDLLCPICMGLIKDAFLTACGHSFCYMCIVTHLNHKSDCPCCANYLTKAQLYPNFLLDKVVKKMSARQVAKTASPIDQFRHVVQQAIFQRPLPNTQIQVLPPIMKERRATALVWDRGLRKEIRDGSFP